MAVLGGDAKHPFGVGLVPATGGTAEYIYPSLDASRWKRELFRSWG